MTAYADHGEASPSQEQASLYAVRPAFTFGEDAYANIHTLENTEREQLISRGIAAEVTVARDYRTATEESHGQNYRENGWNNLASALPGLEIPICTIAGSPALPQLRPRIPRINSHGKPVKYEYPTGELLHIDIHPFLTERIRGTEPLIITEGVMKADSAISQGLCCVALMGVWNWRGRNNQGGITALPEWQDINLRDRSVYIAFDSDAATNPQVGKALTALRTYLIGKGAKVHTVVLPRGAGGEKTGLDDFFARDGNIASDFWNVAAESQDVAPSIDGASLIAKLNEEIAILEEPGGALLYVPKGSGKHQLVSKTNLDYIFATTCSPQGKPVISWWLAHNDRRRFRQIVFEPGLETSDCYNLWQGWRFEAVKGDCSLYWQHVRAVVCDNDEQKYLWLRKWMAHAIQRPRELPLTAPILLGDQGTGKGRFVTYFAELFGEHKIQISSTHELTGSFNAHLANKLFVFADEATWGGDKQREGILKGMITEPTMLVNQKNQPQYTVANYKRYIFASNEDWAVAIGKRDRRFVVFEVSDCRRNDIEYFRALTRQMNDGGQKALMWDLQNEDLTHWNPQERPENASSWGMMLQGLPAYLRFWYTVLLHGGYDFKDDDGLDKCIVWENERSAMSRRDCYAGFVHYNRKFGGREKAMHESLFFRKARERGLIGSEAPRSRVAGQQMRWDSVPLLADARKAFQREVGQGDHIWDESDVPMEPTGF